MIPLTRRTPISKRVTSATQILPACKSRPPEFPRQQESTCHIKQFNTTPTRKTIRKSLLIYGSQRLSWKARKAPSNALPLCKWLAGLLRVTLIGALAISGCNSKDSGEHADKQGKQSQQE
jgi:hypothetical protein